jgi:hypothetical protein
MSLPYYTKHLSDYPVVGYDGLSLLSPHSPIGLTQYSFVPGFFDNFNPILLDTGNGKPKLVPHGPITLYNPLNPFEDAVTLTPQRNLLDMLVSSNVTKTYTNLPLNLSVNITGSPADVDKVIQHLKTLS